ncbi:hypothetical protein YC2023_051230 [Brassica napus]
MATFIGQVYVLSLIALFVAASTALISSVLKCTRPKVNLFNTTPKEYIKLKTHSSIKFHHAKKENTIWFWWSKA